MIAINYSLNNSFAETIKKLMQNYNSDLENDKINTIKGSINDIKNIMVESIGIYLFIQAFIFIYVKIN